MLSKKVKYALRALQVLAQSRDERWPAHALAAAAEVPRKYLEAILVALRDAGILDSQRGVQGGHRLARQPTQVFVGDVIRIFDGPLAPLRCASVTAYAPCTDCPNPERCTLRALMGDVRQAMSDVLDRQSIADLATRKPKRISAPEPRHVH